MDEFFDAVVRYTVRYCEEYKATFDRLIAPEPEGEGLPRVPPTPFASEDPLDIYVLSNGAVFADCSHEPEYQWHIAGGPGIRADTDPSSTPSWVTMRLRDAGLLETPIGIYRIVGKDFPPLVFAGILPPVRDSLTDLTTFGKPLHFKLMESDVVEVVKRLTFGAFGHILDMHFKADEGDFWDNHHVQDLGFIAPNYTAKRFFHLLEVCYNRSLAAWDVRSLWLRVRFDCYRDILNSTYLANPGGARMSFSSQNIQLRELWDRTREFERAVEGLQHELLIRGDDYEATFQRFLETFPQLIDLYGEVIPRPRLIYPEGESPTGKSFVEPDFIVKYTDRTFRIVEIERPSKGLATASGQPRREVTQAAFQITEFRRYIEDHAHLLQDRFPGIRASACRYTIVIGRRVETHSAFTSFDELRSFLVNTFNADEVLVYEDLISRARAALEKLRSISTLSPRQDRQLTAFPTT